MTEEDHGLWQQYGLDADDALREIETALLALESSPRDTATVHRLYRALHTLKGNSAVLGLSHIEAFAHAVEDIVGVVRDGAAALDAALIELLLALTDALASIVREAVACHADAGEAQVAGHLTRAHDWLALNDRRGARENAATRGQILIWSDSPGAEVAPAPETTDQDPLSTEIFLALAAKTLEQLHDLLGQLGSGAPGARASAQALCDDLSAAAERMRLAEVQPGLASLRAALAREDSTAAQLDSLGAALCEALAALESSYRARTPQARDYGLGAKARAWSSRQAGRVGPADQLVRSEPAPSAASDGHAAARVPSQRASRAATRLSLRSPTRTSLRSIASRRPARVVERRKAEAEAQAHTDYLRIDASKLSLVMELMGELALAAGAVTHHPELEGRELEGFDAAAHKLDVLIRELQNEVAAMRLVPVAGVFQRMQRVVRDTAKRTGKRVELQLLGEETEIDKITVDALHDPLVHCVRNAIDHGLETPEERVRAGKSPVGKLVLEALHRDGDVRVRVRDDGRGIDRSVVLERARERGVVGRDAHLSDAQILDLVFLPGFSTKAAIDELSGRGVGMDVIKTAVTALRGRVQLTSRVGEGTSLDLTLPLTLAFVDAMVISERERLFALPVENVLEVFRVEPHQLVQNSADDATLLKIRDQLVPVLWLHQYYGERRASPSLEGRPVVVVQTSQGGLALPVDRLLGNQPIMLKPLKGILSHVRAAAGCGILRTGDVALALDCERLHAS